MDEAARKSARRRATIAFVTAGVLVVVSVVGLIGVDRRHDRFDRVRDRVEDRMERRAERTGPGRWSEDGSGPAGEGRGAYDDDGPPGPGMPGMGQGTDDGRPSSGGGPSGSQGPGRSGDRTDDQNDGQGERPTPADPSTTTTAPATAGGV